MAIPTPEVVRSIPEASEPRFRACVGLCAFAGLRLGGTAALQVGDVDFLRRKVVPNVTTTEGRLPPTYAAEQPWTMSQPSPEHETGRGGRVAIAPGELRGNGRARRDLNRPQYERGACER